MHQAPPWVQGWGEAKQNIRLHRGVRVRPSKGNKVRHSPSVQTGPQGWAEARQHMGLALQGPWVGRARQWGAGDWPCCAGPGTGADIPEDWDGLLGHGQP